MAYPRLFLQERMIYLKANDFTAKLCEIASINTVYAWGMFGSKITESTVNAKAKQYPSWYTEYRLKTVFSPLYGKNPAVWGFDCIGLIKGVLWGWGNVVYASNGVPDLTADSMISKCSNVSSDFSSIAVGEYLWMKGHCGIYIGNGLAVESSPKWKNGVQITACNCSKQGYNSRYWTKHGRLPYIEYETKGVNTVIVELSVLRKGSKGEEVKTLQRLMNCFGHNLSVDGDFGSRTNSALRSYQQSNNLEVDGICGTNSWNSLLK